MPETAPIRTDTVVIGGSAGAMEALKVLVRDLPEDAGVSYFVVIHFPIGSTSVLPEILSRRSRLPAHHVVDREEIHPNRIYVAPPGCHLLHYGDHVRLVDGPRENGVRPAIDPLFRTAARARGAALVGVLLSGMLDDGTQGAAVVRHYGGTIIVQDPEEAMFPSIPLSAMRQVGADHVLSTSQIAAKIAELARRGEPLIEGPITMRRDATEMSPAELAELERSGVPSTFTCPECHGTLFELSEEGGLHYRCRVGHAYNFKTLASEQRSMLEAALWTALRSIEENNSLLRRLIDRSASQNLSLSAEHYRSKLAEGEERANLLRHVLADAPDASS